MRFMEINRYCLNKQFTWVRRAEQESFSMLFGHRLRYTWKTFAILHGMVGYQVRQWWDKRQGNCTWFVSKPCHLPDESHATFWQQISSKALLGGIADRNSLSQSLDFSIYLGICVAQISHLKGGATVVLKVTGHMLVLSTAFWQKGKLEDHWRMSWNKPWRQGSSKRRLIFATNACVFWSSTHPRPWIWQ